jgi:quercetin dioxygenase-like cupin family protein
MAIAGQIIENPVTGERITFRRTAADTAGELLELDLELAPGGKVPGAHRHPEQEERFEVLSGRMEFRLGLRRIVTEAGDVVTVPAGRVHRFANAGDEVAHVRVQVRPALEMERLLETTVALAQEGRTWSSGMPRPLDLALFTRTFEAEVAAPFPPAWVVRDLLRPLHLIATRRGLGARYAPAPAPAPVAAPVPAFA